MKAHHFVVACFGLSVFSAAGAHADVTVGGLFSEHMVLQRDVPLPVWGTAEPDEVVTVTVDGRSAAVRADAQGRWQVKLDPLSAAGPHQMVISGQNTITIDDVLVGEVWICSGQSNMAFQVQRALNPEEEITAADHPRIRLFVVPRHPADEPQTAVNSQWQVCSPETVGSFSAVGYFFGRELHKTMDVPVGLIDSSVGGTPAEAWTPRPALEAEPDFKPIFERWARAIANYKPPQDTAKTQPSAARKKAGKSAARSRPATQPASRSSSRPASRPATRPVVEPRKSPQRPSVLYNGMIHPLIPYAIRGAISYQGEGNASRAYQYRKLFPAMIRSWRQVWGQGDFPFLFVQLANYHAQQKEPYASSWAELREAQLKTLALPATAIGPLQRDDSPAHSLRHPRGDLVSGRGQLQAGLPIPQAVPHNDPQLAAGVGAGGLPIPVRAVGELSCSAERTLCQQLGGTPRGPVDDARTARNGHGRDDRHR